MAFDRYPDLRPVHCYLLAFLSFYFFFIQEIIFLLSAFSNKASNIEVFPFLSSDSTIEKLLQSTLMELAFQWETQKINIWMNIAQF